MLEVEKISLSEDLKYWRAERPDEWIMDRFIQKAEALERYAQKENKEAEPSTSNNNRSNDIASQVDDLWQELTGVLSPQQNDQFSIIVRQLRQ